MAKRSCQGQGPDSSVSGEETNANSDGEQNEGEWYDRADHPLLNDLVLRKILDYATGKELKPCRLVNKKWNIFSIPFSRSRLQVTIRGTGRFSNAEKEIGNFTKLMRSNILGIPFGRYKLGSFDTSKGFGQQFVQLCGNPATELILNDFDVHKVEDISELLRSMPKLESFTLPAFILSKGGGVVELFPGSSPELSFLKSLDITQDRAIGRRRFCPTFYEELLGASPNVSTFVMNPSYEDVCTEVLEPLEKLGREACIQGLILPRIDRKTFELLRKMGTKGMKLKELNFYLKDPVENNPDRMELLTFFKDTLISLTVCYSTYTLNNHNNVIIFPTMPKLIKLGLRCETTSLSCEDFSKTFPVLQELHFMDSTQSTLPYDILTLDKSSTMKRLTINYHPEMNMERFNWIHSVFPALTMLACPVTKEDGVEVIRKIFTHMTQLQGLHIRGTLPRRVDVDSLLTGIQVRKLKTMRVPDFFCAIGQTTTKIQRENIFERMMMNIDSTRPSIRNLKNLRSLSLDLMTGGSRIQKSNSWSELTAYFGLYSVKTLRHVYVYNCEFSAPCCEILVKDMDLMTWSFTSPIHLKLKQIIPRRSNDTVYE